MVVKNIIIIFFISLCVLSAADLDKEMLGKSKTVDFVRVANDESYFAYQDNDNESASIIAPDNYNAFELVPKIKFFDSPDGKGFMAIVSLADGEKYLNASFFDRIDLDGICTNCSVAIADKKLFKKDDNIPIGRFEKSIDLSFLINKIDFRQLKYLVFFAPKKEDIKINKITFAHTRKKPLSLSSSVWIWSSKDIDIKKIKNSHIKTVYLQIDDKFEESVALLDKEGIEVYALDGSPSYIFNDQALMDNIDKVIQMNKIKKVVKGFQVDIEPHTLKDFGFSAQSHLRKLTSLSKSIKEKCHSNLLLFSIVIPFWYDTIYIDNNTVAYSLIDISDEVVLMSYRVSPSEIILISADKLAYAQAKDKKVKLGIELMPIYDESHKVYDTKDIKKCKSINEFPQNCKDLKPINEFSVKGSNISFYNQEYKLNDLLRSDINYSSFSGFVYHHIKALK